MDAARQAGRINAGRLATCNRLQRAHALLADGAEHSTAEVAEAGRAYAVSPLISELRANGAWIECRCTVPNIDRVAEEAVNLRNRYVHGAATRIDYSDNPDLERFLTDTLEFVFAASDLVEAGWNIHDWIKRGSHIRHPFGSYLEDYAENWKELNRLIDAG